MARTLRGLRTEIKKRKEKTYQLLDEAHEAYMKGREWRQEGARLQDEARKIAYETDVLEAELRDREG